MLNYFWKSKLKELSKRRPNLAREEFVELLKKEGYSQNSIENTYNRLSNYLPKIKGFSIYPSDDVLKDYDIDDEDLGDILGKLFDELGMGFPTHEQQKAFYSKYGSEVTVKRIVQFVEEFKKT